MLSTMLLFILSYVSENNNDSIDLNKSFTVLWICDLVLKGIYLLLGIIALILLLRQTSISLIDVRRSRILIALRHFLYILSFSSLNGIVFIYRRNTIEKSTFLILSAFFEIVIDFIKVNELNLIKRIRAK